MRALIVIALNMFVCTIVAVPAQNDITKGFQAAMTAQNLQTILISIEERLRNLDNIYSMHVSPTSQEKLEQYQRKIESIDTKMNRLESLMLLNLDKISENISTKNFKDDIAKTSLLKKIDAIYEGLSHRLSYLDRKFEGSLIKVQNKQETTVLRLEKMEEGLNTKSENIEMELSDAIAAIDDIKTTCSLMEQNIVNSTNDYFEVSLKEQMTIVKNYNDKSNIILESLLEDSKKNFHQIGEDVKNEIKIANETQSALSQMNKDLKHDLNEYAIKVADMNVDNWKRETFMREKQISIENTVNSTKTEIQNGLRNFMLHLGKISKPDHPPEEHTQMDQLNEKIEFNFERLLSAQNVFMDNCYRLQMDESQLESKISLILERLIETFEKKTTVDVRDIKVLEKLIKNHDSRQSKSLYQVGTNVITIHEKIASDHDVFEKSLKQATENLNDLLVLVRGKTREDGFLKKEVVGDLSGARSQLSVIIELGDDIKDTMEEIKHAIETQTLNKNMEIIFQNISKNIPAMDNGSDHLQYFFNASTIASFYENVTAQLHELKEIIVERTSKTSEKNVSVEDEVVSFFSVPEYDLDQEIMRKFEKNKEEIERVGIEELLPASTEYDFDEVGSEKPNYESLEFEKNETGGNNFEAKELARIINNYTEETSNKSSNSDNIGKQNNHVNQTGEIINSENTDYWDNETTEAQAKVIEDYEKF